MAELVNFLLHDKDITCMIHALLSLPHQSNCVRPKRVSANALISQQAEAAASTAEILRGVAEYFLPRFPSLIVSVHHLVAQRWRQTSTFGPFFSGTLPPLLPAFVTAPSALPAYR